MDNVINITVRNRIAVVTPGEHIICGNGDYSAVFDFDDEWSGIDTKTARFYRNGIYTDVVFEGDTVEIPEVANVSSLEIGVFAGDMTTTPAYVRCYKSILCKGGNVADPPPDVYDQIIAMLNAIKNPEETDPTVPEWLKAVETLEELKALVAELPEADESADLGKILQFGLVYNEESGIPEPGYMLADPEYLGGSGADGGYYAPTVTQTDENTMLISFTPSDTNMPLVEDTTIALPAGADGEAGATGPAGSDGYTPVRGTDYWTDDDKAEINTYIVDELAKRDQLAPEFANSVDECTDTSKLYVLPDGYIYAYMCTEIAAYINQIPISTDDDGSVFNTVGWVADSRVNSSGSVVEVSGYNMTGYIPCTRSDVLRLGEGAFSENTGYNGIALFDSDKGWISTYNRAVLSTCSNVTLNDDGSAEIAFTSSNFDSAADFAYVRVWGAGIGDNAVITVNEEITDEATVTEYAWANTGHAFVPADYEDRIVEVEESVSDHESRLNTLESTGVEGVPEYVVTEAEDVLDRIVTAQGDRTFTLAAISDLHYGNSGNTDGVKHLCEALKYIDKRVKLDAVAVLGDYTDGYPASDYNNAVQDFRTINATLDSLRFAPNLRTQGNHDYYADHTAMTHRHIQMYSDGVVWGSVSGGYFYRDFDGFNLRVIVLNTTEEGNDYVCCSTAQYQWFADALNLSDKDDAADWQILILSHHPLDWYVSDGSYKFCYIVDAYANGASWTDGTISCDYSGKNAATLIGNIHGHIHNLLTDYVHFGNVVNGSKSTVLRMCTPEACVGRANQYTGAWAEETSYTKTTGTAEETSGCVYCIDLDAHTITAVCYGAGYDREINY